MAIRKRQLVLAALVVALGAAVYLNWQFGGNSQIVDAGTSVSDKELGAAQLVNGSVDSSPSSAVSEAVSSAVSGNVASEASSEAANTGANTDVNTYFAQARLERQKSRDASQELVQKVLDDTTADENTKKAFVVYLAMRKLPDTQTKVVIRRTRTALPLRKH